MKKILIINPFGIGDVLFSTVLIDVIKDNIPGAGLYYISNKRTYEVLKASPELKGVFMFEKDDYKRLWKDSKIQCLKSFFLFLKQIKREKFDLAIDLSMGHQYSFFLMLLGVPQRVGFNYKGRGRFLTKKLEFDGFNTKPIAEYHLDLARVLGLEVKNPLTKIWIEAEDKEYIDKFLSSIRPKKDIIIGIAPGGGVSFGKKKINFKRWDPENFAELADKLIEGLACEVIFVWGPDEEALIKKIISLMKNKPKIAPPTTIRQAAALMKRCDCVICNDSGPLHVAVAAGARTVSIFGPSNELVYGPYPPAREHLVITKDIDCRPCYKKFKLPDCRTRACLKELDAKSVFLAVANHTATLYERQSIKRKERFQ